MLPILIKFNGLTVYTYGFMLALGFVAAFILARMELARKGMDKDIAYDLAIFALIGGIVGGRAVYVLGHLDEYAKQPLAVFATWEGGLVFYGGLVGGALAVLAFVWRKRLPVGKVADVMAPGLAVGSAFGRIGCFSNGCCYGLPTALPWGVTFSNPDSVAPLGIMIHPTQLYEFGYNILALALIWRLRKRIDKDGVVFWIFVGLYGLFRFTVEFFRIRQIVLMGLGGSQLFSLAMIAAAIIAFGYIYGGQVWRPRRRASIG